MPHDPNDAKQVKQAEQRDRRKALEASEHLRVVMETESGRAVMRGVIGMGDLMSDGYVPGGPDRARHQDYLAGKRAVSVDVLAMINLHCPQLGELMMREGHEAEKREREREAAADRGEDEDQQENTDG